MRSKVGVASFTKAGAFCISAVVFCIAMSIVLLFFSTGAFGYTLEETFEQTLSAEGVSSLKLGNINGTVRVEGWERDEISIEATKKVRARDREEAEEIVEGLKVEIRRDEGAVRIETIYPKRRRGGFWSALFGGVTRHMSVDYEVYVPGEMDLDLHTTNGRVEVEEVSGEVATHTTNGRIDLREVEGSVRVRTTNGGVKVEGLVGMFDISTTNGSIEVGWSRGGVGDSRAHTTNGRITLRVPKEFSAVLDASTTNGRVRTEVPLTIEGTISKRKVRGTLGEGGPLLKLRTTNGNIDIVEGGRVEGAAPVELEEKERRTTVKSARPRRVFRHRRRGDMIRFVGNVLIEEDEVVVGDVVTIGGSITVLGNVVGDVVAVFGGVKLGPKAVVDGDVVSVGGKTEVSEGARVSGEVFVGAPLDSLRTGIPCSGIEIVGNATVPSEEILVAIPLKVGDVLTADVLMDVEDALWDMKWFSDVDVVLKDVEKGAVVLISVEEQPTVQVSEVVVVDGEAFSLEAIRDRSGLVPGRYTEEELDRACERIEDLYRDQGYAMASVSRAYDPESGRLTVTVDEGRIEEIRIEGARFVKEDEIREELGIWEGQLYVSQQVKEALDRMKQAIGKFREVTHSVRDGVLTVLVKEERPFKSDTDLTTRFNRVESLFIGADLSASTVFELQGRAYLRGGYSFGTKAWQYTLGAEKSWFRTYRLAIGANSHDVVDTQDRWRVDDDEASGLAIFGFEPRDYFRRWGTELYWTQRIGDFGRSKVSYIQDEYKSVSKNTDWSLFNRRHIKRLNPPVDEGQMKSLKASWTVRHGGWLLWTEGEISGEGFGGDFEFRRVEADVRRTLRLAPDQILRLRVRAGTSEGALPVQKRFELGGIGTLPGYRYKAFEGDRMVLANVEYRFGGDAALVPFLGAGRVWRSGEKLAFEKFKANVGVALELGESEDSRLRVSWAVPTGRPARKGRWTLRFDKAF